uniref:Cytochrome P450 n=1 Tax=Haemonchus contortus TaxID=6289 RepID=A0A7I4XZE0_HAECO
MILFWLIPYSVAIIYLLVWLYYEKVENYPKGPRPYPIVGNLLTLNISKLSKEIEKYSKIYGGIFTIWLPKPHVVIAGYEHAKEAFSKNGDDYACRCETFPETIFQNATTRGVIYSQGYKWDEQRRMAHFMLKSMEMGKNLMVEQVLLSAEDFLKHLSSMSNREEVCLKGPTEVFVANNINKMLFGFSYEYDNCDRLVKIIDGCNTLFKKMKGSKLTLFGHVFPVIYRFSLLRYFAMERFRRILRGPSQIIKEDVARALKSYSVNQEPECFVQAYDQKMHCSPALNEDKLLELCMDFFMAGMESTTLTLRWATLLLAAHTDKQEKIREEILSVLGHDGKPNSSAWAEMRYTRAAIQEIQRFTNIVPVSVTHRTIRTTTIETIRIPADTLVMSSANHTMAYLPAFENGHEFQPERFLEVDGIPADKAHFLHLCPFPLDEKQCTREEMVRVELIVFLVALLRYYKVMPVEGQVIDLEPTFATLLIPKQQPLQLIPIRR